MRKKNVYLTEPQITRLVRDGANGHSVTALIGKYKISRPTVLGYLRAGGASIKSHIPKIVGHAAEIIGLRKAKMTYAAIGKRYGVSRQRVQQKLAEIAPELLGHKFINPDWGLIATCAKCNKQLTNPQARLGKYCPACNKLILKRAHMANFLMREHLRVAAILDMRNSGMTWKAIGDILFPGTKGVAPRTQNLVARFRKVEGILKSAKY